MSIKNDNKSMLDIKFKEIVKILNKSKIFHCMCKII